MQVRELEPKTIWNHFEDLNAVPRPSKKEERVRAFMVDFGKSNGLQVLEDDCGNIIIKKAATAGMESKATVIIQSHLDMVHQKNNDTDFDFLTQGIQSWIDGDWVKAKGTTLGADNGMGVAAAMTLLSSKDIDHPALECLFTIDEETGMTGAKELDGSLLTGEYLLNLDTEDDDEISIGCAGGIDTNTSYSYDSVSTSSNSIAFEITLKGLKGGHSGMDIHIGRGNANLLLNRLIFEFSCFGNVQLASFEGGGLRNAIPREAKCIVVVDGDKNEGFFNVYNTITTEITSEFSVVEPSMTFSIKETSLPNSVVSIYDMPKILGAIYNAPNAVWKMSDKIEGLVETSSSLAKVSIKDGKFITQSLQRSMIESGKRDIANALRINFERIGADVVQNGDYPGWAPNPDSKILDIVVSKYKAMYNEVPKVQACHAGLECGILNKHLPNCDMVSFGPTIKNPHSPDEKVNIKSVLKFWGFLLEVLKEIPNKK
ncbi:MAG: aminoacyl-histidine dipeptidase [Crocinitomicaceae bacterium]